METNLSIQKKAYCFLLTAFFRASGNHYLRYKEAYLKLLLQPFYFIFPIFLSVGPDFLFSRNSILLFTDFFFLQFLQKHLIAASGNQFSV